MTNDERHEPEEGAPRRTVKITDKRHSAKPPADPPSGEQEPVEELQAAEDEPTGEDAGSGADIGSVRAEAAEYLDHLRRLKAEFDNYRKRVLKEQTRAVELATEPLMTKLLEVLDEFELAVMAAESKPDFERFRRGVEMVYGKLQEILRSEGLERVDADGRPFDPEVHEALLQVDEGDGEETYVADVLRTGYRLKGRLLRPAGVKVARR